MACTATNATDEGRLKHLRRQGISAIFVRTHRGQHPTQQANKMHSDSPDTIAIEDSQWKSTESDDVFLPGVRVQLA